MQDLMLRAYKASLQMEPIALRDYFVKIITYPMNEFFRKVVWYEAIPPFQCVNTGAIAAGVQGARTNITNLDVWDNEFGQWRWFPLDNVQVRLYLPSGVGKWQMKNLQVGLDQSILVRDPTLLTTEFNSWEDQRPAVECVNFSAYALAASRIVAWGYRFATELPSPDEMQKLKDGKLPFTPIDCAGRQGTAKR